MEGLRARGAVGVSMSWSGGKLKSATLNYSPSNSSVILSEAKNLSKAKSFTIRTSVPVKVKGASASSKRSENYYLTKISLKPGKDCVLTAK